ncbi:MAG: toprim domain-containing protein [Candidatus Wallbacteria bacterium]|nr:toprim domain-containing protein [Candidatus Wallbacteria bacterium]
MSHSARWRHWRTRIRIVAILDAIGRLQEFRVRGPRLVGPCPIHGGDNPQAFSVHQERNLWFCFTRCRRGGNVVDLAWLLSAQSWPRTARWLEQLAMASPDLTPLETSQTGHDPGERSRLFRPYTRHLLLDPAHPFFRKLGLTPETVSRFEAGAWHGKGLLQRTVAVRLHDLEGNPLGYAGRRLDPAEVRDRGKWTWPPHFPKGDGLWNWHRIDPDGPAGLVLVEGPWSVMKLWQADVPNTVALGGVYVTQAQRRLMARARQLTLFLDGDEVGQAATTRLVAQGLHSRLRVIQCPSGTDPADLSETALARLLEPI